MRRYAFLPVVSLMIIFLTGCPKVDIHYSLSGVVRPYSGEEGFTVQRKGYVPELTAEDIERGFTDEYAVIFDSGYDSTILPGAEVLGEFSSRDGSVVISTVRTSDPQALAAIEGVRSVQRNMLYTLQSVTTVPDDPLYTDQWGYPMVQMEEAWTIAKGSPTVVVAIIDSGTRPDHPDLQGVFLPGYDLIDDDDDPTDNPNPGRQSHGTHVTGTITAVTNNGTGVSGMTWGRYPTVMPIKVFDNGGNTTDTIIAEGIIYAVDHGAKVINMSLAGPDTEAVRMAVEYAYANEVMMIAAAGNYNTSYPYYPASYDEVISVSAVGPTMERASYSNYGDFIDFAAPGGDSKVGGQTGTIISTGYTSAGGNGYTYLSGTSMACPHVTGLVALLMGEGYIGRDSNGEEIIRKIIRKTALDLGDPGWDEYYGYGLIQAANALSFIEEKRPFVVQVLSIGGSVLAQSDVRPDGSFKIGGLKDQNIKLRVWRDVNANGVIDKGDLVGYAGYSGWEPAFENAALLFYNSSGEKELAGPVNFSPVM